MILDHLHVYLLLPQNFTSQSLFGTKKVQWHRETFSHQGLMERKKKQTNHTATTNKGRHKMMYLSQVRIKSPHVGMLQGTKFHSNLGNSLVV